MASSATMSARALTVVLVTGVIGVFLVRPLFNERAEDRAPSTTTGATAEESIGTLEVRDASGNLVPIVTPGEPSIVMVSSTTCGWCKRALRDIGEMANGRPVPRLKLLTLEGADQGAPMLSKEGIVGAQLIGPAGQSDQVLLTFRYSGTPTFVAIDRNGRIARTMPGYPIREEMQHWFNVMIGSTDVP
jgi:thioredoxin-related protein